MTINENGNPAIFAIHDARPPNWKPMLPGEVGTRAAVRLDDFYNTDLALTKYVPPARAATGCSSAPRRSTPSTT